MQHNYAHILFGNKGNKITASGADLPLG